MDNEIVKDLITALIDISKKIDLSIGNVGDGSIVNQNGLQYITLLQQSSYGSPKEIQLKAISNFGIVFTLIGMLVAIISYIFIMGYAVKLKDIPILYGISLGLWIYIPAILLIGSIVIGIIYSTDYLSFLFNSSHVTYKSGVISYGGKEYVFYDHIWDIKLGNKTSNKVIYCYIVDDKKNNRQASVLRLRFHNEAEAKYLHDIFHAGQLKRLHNNVETP